MPLNPAQKWPSQTAIYRHSTTGPEGKWTHLRLQVQRAGQGQQEAGHAGRRVAHEGGQVAHVHAHIALAVAPCRIGSAHSAERERQTLLFQRKRRVCSRDTTDLDRAGYWPGMG